MNVLTLGVIGIIVLGIVIGSVKVFAQYVTNILIAAFSIVLVIYTAPILSKYIENHTRIDDIIVSKVEKVVEQDMEDKVKLDYWMETQDFIKDQKTLKAMVRDAYAINPKETARVNLLRYAGLPKGMTDLMIEHVKKYDATYIKANGFGEYAAKFVVGRFMLLVSALIVAHFIFGAADSLRRFKESHENNYTVAIGRMNKIGGAILGGFAGLLIVWGIFILCQNVEYYDKALDAVHQIKASPLLSFINKNNVVATLYNWINYS